MLGKLLANRIARLLDSIDSDPRMQHLIDQQHAAAAELRQDVRNLHRRLVAEGAGFGLTELAETLSLLRTRCTPDLVHCVDPLDHAIHLVKEAIGLGEGKTDR